MASKPPVDDKHLEELLSSPEIYADGYQGVSIANGVAKLNFYTNAFDPSTGKISKVAAVRLACSVTVLVGIHEALGRLVRDLEKQGVVQRSDVKAKKDA
jgi:hypothetical protein